MRQTKDKGRVAYNPNSIGGGCPFQAMMSEGGFHTYEERVDARKVRARSDSFRDHFTQAALFYNSQSAFEKEHIINAFSFELSKVEIHEIRERMVANLSQVDANLAQRVATNLGFAVPKPDKIMNHVYGADTDPKTVQPTKKKSYLDKSEALSMANTVKDTIKTRKVAVLATDGVDGKALAAVKSALEKAGATVKVIAPKLGTIKAGDGSEIKVDEPFFSSTSVVYDAVYVAGGQGLADEPDAVHFVNEAFRHCKAIAAGGDGADFVRNETFVKRAGEDKAVILGEGIAKRFIQAIARHRNWDRENARKVPA